MTVGRFLLLLGFVCLTIMVFTHVAESPPPLPAAVVKAMRELQQQGSPGRFPPALIGRREVCVSLILDFARDRGSYLNRTSRQCISGSPTILINHRQRPPH
jgi:hypothetical protein